MKAVKVLPGQTLIDIAVQELGDADRVLEIAVLNDMELTTDLVAGSLILVPDADQSKRSTVSMFSNTALAPASADTEQADEANEGIDYWAIENDFIVQ